MLKFELVRQRVCAAWLVTLLVFAAAPAAASTNILVLHSHSPEWPDRHAIDEGLRDVLESPAAADVVVHSETIEVRRFTEHEYSEAILRYLANKYSRLQLDVIAAVHDPAFDFLVKQRARLFPGVPIVALLSKHQSFPADAAITAIWTTVRVEQTVHTALTLDPDINRIAVVEGTVVNRDDVRKEVLGQLRPFGTRVAVEYLKDLPLDAVVEQLRQLPGRSAVLFVRQTIGASGQSVRGLSGLDAVLQASPVPVYVVSDQHLGSGAVGGIVYDTIGNGQQLAKTALRIAAGAPAAEIPSVEGIRTAQFDARALDRWNLRHQLLPPHSRILFHSPGFWERYRGYAWAALSLLLLQSMLIAGLLVQRVRRRRAERSLRDSEAALRTSAGQSQDLAGRLIAAQEDERRRLATDLNDDLSQGLALLSIELEQLERRRPPAGASQPSPVKAIVARVAEIATSVHEISHRLHPARLELVGLSSSIGGLCRDVSAKHGVEIDFREEDLPAKIDADITICLYRVVQEALRNITRHSGASDVTISLSFKKGKFLLFVADSGKGFDVERRPTTGLGLVSMRERVNFLNGRLVVHSERGEGTILFVEIPCSVGASGRSAVA